MDAFQVLPYWQCFFLLFWFEKNLQKALKAEDFLECFSVVLCTARLLSTFKICQYSFYTSWDDYLLLHLLVKVLFLDGLIMYNLGFKHFLCCRLCLKAAVVSHSV